MKAALVGALRREKMAETTIQDLNVEIDRMKCSVCIFLSKNSQNSTFLSLALIVIPEASISIYKLIM